MKAYMWNWSRRSWWKLFSCIYLYIIFDHSVSFFLFITFWCFTCKNLQHIFPPISDNNYFSYSIRFLLYIFGDFNHLAYNYLCLGVISIYLFVLFPIRAIFFSSTLNMSYFSLILPTLINFLVLPNFLNHVIACYFTKFSHWVIR